MFHATPLIGYCDNKVGSTCIQMNEIERLSYELKAVEEIIMLKEHYEKEIAKIKSNHQRSLDEPAKEKIEEKVLEFLSGKDFPQTGSPDSIKQEDKGRLKERCRICGAKDRLSNLCGGCYENMKEKDKKKMAEAFKKAMGDQGDGTHCSRVDSFKKTIGEQGDGSRGGRFDSSKSLSKFIESDCFARLLDKQIAAQIFKTTVFRKYLFEIVDEKDAVEIVSVCPSKFIKAITATIKGSENSLKDQKEELRRALGQESEERTIQVYREMFQRVVECLNQGSLSCDNQFLKLVGRTIRKLGVYEDPAMCKMTVQFVLCKRYAEDYVKIKTMFKEFMDCDL